MNKIDLIESLLVKISNHKEDIQESDMFSFVDTNIDDWGLDIGDLYLDELVTEMLNIKRKRDKLSKDTIKCGSHVIFKKSDECLEKIALKKVSKQYDKLYMEATTIVTQDDTTIYTEETSVIVGSWEQTLERIEMIYKKVDN